MFKYQYGRKYRRAVCALALIVGVAQLAGCSLAGESAAQNTPLASSAELAAIASQEDDRALQELTTAYPDVAVPDVSRIEFVSMQAWPYAIAECLNDEGFEVDVKDGGVGGTILDSQREPYAVAMYVCRIEYAMDPKFNVPFEDSQLNYLYDYYTGDLTACLEDQGITVAEPPSRQQFLETYGSENWSPYASVTADVDWSKLNSDCPQIPEDLFQ